jgi:hypothetical protein
MALFLPAFIAAFAGSAGGLRQWSEGVARSDFISVN